MAITPVAFRAAPLDFFATGQLLRLIGEGKVDYFDDPDGAMCGVVVATAWGQLSAHLNDAGAFEDETDWRPHFLDDEDNLRTVLERVGRAEVLMIVGADNAVVAYVFADRAQEVLVRLLRSVTTIDPPFVQAGDAASVDGPHVRVYPPDATAGDFGPMYVLDALGVSMLVRQRDDGMYVHIDRDATTPAPAGTEDQPLIVEVNNGGENTYG